MTTKGNDKRPDQQVLTRASRQLRHAADYCLLKIHCQPKKENGRVLGAPLCEVLDCGSRWWLTGLFSPAEEELGFVW